MSKVEIDKRFMDGDNLPIDSLKKKKNTALHLYQISAYFLNIEYFESYNLK